ncbi:ATPase family protein associated with various cellular activities (AAA) [Tenacibaculum gallaicum]|uniref:ATPase family protein associated with various cellular activities (AAA) n=1 Tax=Tenacibaculum gallaicum TaxID=561505 RepID=A0A3E0HJ12_9FLAO|nr:ATP-binding protein [Tenacibaculum gallaicum]REH46388.1 ATPase family protein associated with various cellular activities (AAA) [Tenacibaculum gallaicum]
MIDINSKKSGLEKGFQYLKEVMIARLSSDFRQENFVIPVMNVEDDSTPLTFFINHNKLNTVDTILLLLSLVPNIMPGFLNEILTEFMPNGGEFPEFGGTKGKHYRGIIPTGETALYILGGKNIEERKELTKFMLYESKLLKSNIVEIEKVPYGDPVMSGKLILTEEFVHFFLTRKQLKPQLSQDFPASLITTDLEWDDLVLQEKTLNDVKEIENWLAYKEVLMNDWGMSSKIKPGYRVLFCGLPGTGKTLTAGLLGKHTGKDVYRVDLSMVVSKYIGETEKNLSKLFDKSINKDWILFFDEADSIFGKRTSVRDAHDKYANQEVSYLLQRIEVHPGLIILASNFKNNIDTAFTRRFNNIIEFETPNYEERLVLWKKNLPNKIELEESIAIEELAKKFNITGANIVNVIQYACLKTIANKENKILRQYILEGIKREYTKEGKTTNISI